MKKNYLLLLLCCISMMMQAQFNSKLELSINPIFDQYAADPAPLVHDGKLHVLTVHLGRPDTGNWQISSTKDMKNWTENKTVLSISDFKWLPADSFAWAADLVEYKGKFYIYATVMSQSQKNAFITVAVADNIHGPYKDAKGAPVITSGDYNGYIRPNLDPKVFIDDNDTPYLFWSEMGNTNQCHYAKLNESMIYLDEKTEMVDLPNYTVAPWVHKHKEWYYLSYSESIPTQTGYARSKSINGPWEYMGAIHARIDGCYSNQQAIIEFNKQWYFIFHAGNENEGQRKIYAVKMAHDNNGEIIPLDKELGATQ